LNNKNLKLIILGGLDGIGKNMMAFEYNGSIIIVDVGMMFPDSEMFGIDKVIPDFTYIRENKEKVKAVILTHGHEDHVGALYNLFKEITVPIYGTKLTLALAESKLRKNMYSEDLLNVVKPAQKVIIDEFEVEFMRVSHSIPDGVALSIKTPVGTIIHSGDFKVDHTPIDGKVMDLNRFAQLGDEGVLALLSDSTNADTEGFGLSERVVGETFDRIFRKASHKRIVIVTFASNVHRIQQAINTARKHHRKVAVIGRSMEEVTLKAHENGYLHYQDDTLISLHQLQSIPPERTLIITTGSQGESMSVIARMSREDYKGISINENDCVVLSGTPIPGNEKGVNKVINNIFRRGAQVIYEQDFEVHVSGHACQEELRLLINLVRPKFFIPIHGEYRHLVAHAELADSVGIPRNNIFVLENGDVLAFSDNEGKVVDHVPGEAVLIDGLAEDEPYNIVQADRKLLSRDGILITSFALRKDTSQLLSEVKLHTRGFIYMKEAPELRADIIQKIEEIIADYNSAEPEYEKKSLKKTLMKDLSEYVYTQTKRRPLIVPSILEI